MNRPEGPVRAGLKRRRAALRGPFWDGEEVRGSPEYREDQCGVRHDVDGLGVSFNLAPVIASFGPRAA
jgi:hypothetical protein